MSSVMPEAVQGSWLHSHEEDEPGRTVYRPASFAFPPSRGRQGFDFQPGGALTLRGPGADDRSMAAGGRWSLTPDGALKIEGGAAGQQALQVESAAPDKLVLKT